MKKNREGFMLAEAIITSVVIATAMIGLYTVFNRLYTSYKTRSTYYNVDAIYSAKATFDYVYDNNINLFINNIFKVSNYRIIMDDNNCFYNNQVYDKNTDLSNYNNAVVCQKIRNHYQVNKMLLISYDKTVLTREVMESNINQTFKDYIQYVTGYYDVADNDTRYSYLILTEIKDGDNYYYGHIGIE